MRHPLIVPLVVATLALTGCGGTIEDTVRDQYPDYADKHGFADRALHIQSVKCDNEATGTTDGTCRIRPKGFHLVYAVPYRDDKPLWGESGPE